MKFLNGWKTILGVAGTAATLVFPHVDPGVLGGVLDNANNVVTGAFGLLTLLGVIHKVEKAGR